MLSFDIRSLSSHAVVVDDTLSPDDAVWEEGDPMPSGPIRVTGRLSPAGSSHYYWHGRIEGDAELPCRRCLADTTVHVKDDAQIIFVEDGVEEAEDPDVYVVDSHASELDLRPALREEWLLSAPTFALCREECRGLCPSCGADLNAEQCDCASAADARWEALRKSAPKSD